MPPRLRSASRLTRLAALAACAAMLIACDDGDDAPSDPPMPEPAVEPEPAPEPAVEPTPEPAPEPAVEPAPEPTAEPAPEPAPEPTPDPALRVDLERAAAEVDPRFISFAIDTSQVVGGYWWDPEGEGMGEVGDERVDPFDFDQPRLVELARALAPGFVRIGGSEADNVYYALEDPVPDPLPEGYLYAFTREQYDGVHRFAAAADLDVLFTLNAGPGPRDAELRWQPDAARGLIEYSLSQGYRVPVWELGNEINGYLLFHGWRLDGEAYAEDLRVLRALLDEIDPASKMAGPSSAYWPVLGELAPVLPETVEAAADVLDIVSWHYYPSQSRRCPATSRPAGPEVLLAPSALDELATWAADVEAATGAHAPEAEIWMSESGHAQCGGEPGVSDRFGASFWWLDQLGQLARRGHRVVVRQTLIGSHYGLLDDLSLDPRPDYWASVLWQRLMGSTALSVEAVGLPPTVRAYAHCAADGDGIGLLVMNLDPEPIELPLPAGPAAHWTVTAEGIDALRVELNGVELTDTEGRFDLPEMAPVPVEDDGRLELAGRSYVFVRLTGAAPACDR